jgi:hypothetical protein
MTPAQRTGAILAGLRLLETALDNYDGPENHTLNSISAILTNEGAHAEPTGQEIDALCEELNTQRLNRVVLTVEGGIVQSVGADRPAEVDVVVVEFDEDYTLDTHPTVIQLAPDEGEIAGCDIAAVDHHEVQPLVPSETRWLDALAKREAEPERCPHGYALNDACLDCAADVSNALRGGPA